MRAGAMAGLRDRDKALFPIRDIAAVVEVFRGQLTGGDGPDLALLSIVAGAIENALTCRAAPGGAASAAAAAAAGGPGSLPVLELRCVDALHRKFHAIVRQAAEPCAPGARATRDLVKRVSDVVWNSLTRSYYKDRAHLQSLYSYLTGSKLDCFGVAFAVVAGCQALGYSDVHLALSEDHAWVVFGEGGRETAEVTWHGKGNEDKRGREIGRGPSARSWLYVDNRPVVCTRHMEVAALVSAINPSLNASHDAYEVAYLQQELLWLLYDLGHLKRYPMAIGNLGDLEEIAPTDGRIPCSALFKEAIYSARTYYNNQHVYPYTYQGGYFYRNKMYKEAFESWANASDVIRRYNYSRDDEEIYKEFLEIANELIPHVMKVESSGFSAGGILKRPECFAHLLRFYDGICQWEEGSATPVLHIGWARPLVNTISKFDAAVRARVRIVCDEPFADDEAHHHLHHQQQHRPEAAACINNNNNDCCPAAAAAAAQRDNHKEEREQSSSGFHPSIAALTAACSEKILNPGFLLQGDGSPFVGGDDIVSLDNLSNGKPSTSKVESDVKQPEQHQQQHHHQETEEDTRAEENSKERSNGDDDGDGVEDEEPSPAKVMTIVLRSQKMKQLKDLLLAEKLNTHAISLHLTAQSQVQIGKKGRGEPDTGVRPKRNRRD